MKNPVIARELVGDVEVVIRKLRMLTEQSSHLWRRVPLLALEADGRGGSIEKLSYAYRFGFWIIDESIDRFNRYTVAVDCVNGRLMSIPDTNRKARREDLIRCLLSINKFEAASVIAELEGLARMRFEGDDPEALSAWREKMKQDLNLSEAYVRRGGLARFEYCLE